MHALSVLDQAHDSDQSCDVGSGKNSFEAHILSLMREDICKEVSHVKHVMLKYVVKH